MGGNKLFHNSTQIQNCISPIFFPNSAVFGFLIGIHLHFLECPKLVLQKLIFKSSHQIMYEMPIFQCL